jgi:3-(3-hydroxy-phenyl)propionate hydroxylase
VSSIIAEVEMRGEPEFGFRNDAIGVNAMRPLDGGRVGVVVRDARLDRAGDPTLEDVREAIVAVWGSDFGLASADMISRFTDATRQAATYRSGRALLAGDAAHVHSPAGGQGLNLGVQDAANLGWKLARVVAGVARSDLLDTYHEERHPAAGRVLRYTMALTALQRGDDRTAALSGVLGDVLGVAAARDRLAGLVSGLDVHYDLGGAHALVGRRMPDLELATASGTVRTYTLLHDGRPVLLDLGGLAARVPDDWHDRVELVEGAYVGAWELPVIGEVEAPRAVLIRPDGYVAWIPDEADVGLGEALTAGLGQPPA